RRTTQSCGVQAGKSNPGLDGKICRMQNWRVSDLDEIVGPVESECVPNETNIGRGGAALECAVVCADNGQRVGITGPPSNQAIRRGPTTRALHLKSRERGARQKKDSDAPFPTDSFTAVYKAHPDTSRARNNVIKGFAF